jgi:P4 family phage/plasmid primase-like protien
MFDGDSERIALVHEWFGYCLVHDTSFHKFLILMGEGANGKTVLLLALEALLGSDNVSHVPLELFGERFQLTPTLGKLANVVSEIGNPNRVAEGYLKSFVAGDPMHFDRKNNSVINARPTARLILATNVLPRFSDQSLGLRRRLMLLPCNIVIPPQQQDRQLTAKLETELSGIFNWSIRGLLRLRTTGRFTEPNASRVALEEYRDDLNPTRTFLLEAVCLDPLGSVECSVLYSNYTWAAESDGYKPLDVRAFGKEVHRAFPTVTRDRASSGSRPRFYQGIRLKNEAAVPPPTGPRPVPVPMPVTPGPVVTAVPLSQEICNLNDIEAKRSKR